MIKVLFICTGNICRSPMAEAVFQGLIKEENLTDEISVDSAGIGHWHVGDRPHDGTRKVLKRHTITHEKMIARQVTERDWDNFDYIIAMDDKNLEDLEAIRDEYNNVIIAKIMDYVEEPKEVNVPDPFFLNNFDYVYELINEGCKKLLEQMKQTHKFN